MAGQKRPDVLIDNLSKPSLEALSDHGEVTPPQSLRCSSCNRTWLGLREQSKGWFHRPFVVGHQVATAPIGASASWLVPASCFRMRNTASINCLRENGLRKTTTSLRKASETAASA